MGGPTVSSTATAARITDPTIMPSSGNKVVVVLTSPMARPAMGISSSPPVAPCRKGILNSGAVSVTPSHLAALRASTNASAAGQYCTISATCMLAPA